MKPKSIEFEFGKNAHGQNVTAKREDSYLGHTSWTITIHAAGQRDETTRIHGITDDQMIMFAEAVKTITKR